VQVTLGYYIQDGKKKRKTAQKYGFKTKKEAVAYIQALYTPSEKSKVITLSELWELFQNDLSSLSTSKQTAYRIAWKKIKSEVEYRNIDSFSVPELQELIDNAAPSYYTRRDIKTLLSHLYKIAIRDDYTDKNRTEYLKLPKLETTERQIFSPEDKAKLWKDFQSTPSGIVAGILTMMYTGIRPGELLTIRTENVHLSEHYMTGGIKTAKGKKRKIILPDRIKPVISYLLEHSKRDLLLFYPFSDDFYDDWKQKRADLHINEALTPYCCRHTYITNLTALKVSPAMLQELAGHEDYDTTLEYTHLSIQDRLTEVNRL
jgi:integrase